jgi:hypothetical protein
MLPSFTRRKLFGADAERIFQLKQFAARAIGVACRPEPNMLGSAIVYCANRESRTNSRPVEQWAMDCPVCGLCKPTISAGSPELRTDSEDVWQNAEEMATGSQGD